MDNHDHALVTLKFERGTWSLIEINIQADSEGDIDKLLEVLSRGIRGEVVRGTE